VRGKLVPAANLHLTLAFLGEVGDGRAARLPGIAERVEARAFDMTLDRVGSFAKARVAWAGCERPPAELITLQARLAGELAAAGFTLEERPFAPHLTLARKTDASCRRRGSSRSHGRVEEFALVARAPGRYETAASWRLD
jgi:2'-5' RNA ligase